MVGRVDPPHGEVFDGGWRRHEWPAARDAWHRTDRAPVLPASGPDPQQQAMIRSHRGDAGVPALFAPLERTAHLLRYRGPLAVSAGAVCEVRVLPVHIPPYNCAVRVRCGASILYPNLSQTAGFVSCEVENGQVVRVDDPGFSASDGDPRMHLDLREGTLEIEDQRDEIASFRATLRLR